MGRRAKPKKEPVRCDMCGALWSQHTTQQKIDCANSAN